MSFDPMDHETPAADLESLMDLAFKAKRNWGLGCCCIEVGSWAGRTALVLDRFFDRVYCVDHWRGNLRDRLGLIAANRGQNEVFRTFCRNMGDRLFMSVIPCRGDSQLWASIWPHKVAMVFLDGDHEYDSVKRDILAWRPHIISGGYLVGHDYSAHFPGVKQAVDELIPKADLNLAGQCLWWTRVP